MNTKDIFISYRRGDGRDFAQLLADRLEKDGYSVFLDQSMHCGEHFPTKLCEAVEHANDFIMVISNSYWGPDRNNRYRICEDGDWVFQEIKIAMEHRKRFIPVVIAQGEELDISHLPEDIKEIANFHQIRFRKDDSFDFLIHKIGENVSSQTREHRVYSMYLEKLRAIGSEETDNFNILLRDMVLKASRKEIEMYLFPILGSEESQDIKFLAYYAIYTFYRRLSYYKDIKDLVQKFGDQFVTCKFNNVIYSQFYRYLYEEDGDIANLKMAISFAKKAMELIDMNSGVMLTYAELIIIGLQNDRKQFKKELPSAMFAVEKAISLKPNYPKSIYMYGLLLGYSGSYEQGIGNIQKAIALEDTEKQDSFLRIIDYKMAISELRHNQRYDVFKKHLYVLYSVVAFLVILILVMTFL